MARKIREVNSLEKLDKEMEIFNQRNFNLAKKNFKSLPVWVEGMIAYDDKNIIRFAHDIQQMYEYTYPDLIMESTKGIKEDAITKFKTGIYFELKIVSMFHKVINYNNNLEGIIIGIQARNCDRRIVPHFLVLVSCPRLGFVKQDHNTYRKALWNINHCMVRESIKLEEMKYYKGYE